MATREKKPPAGRKPNTSSPVTPKEDGSSQVKDVSESFSDGPLLVKNPAASRANATSKNALTKKMSTQKASNAKKANKGKPSIAMPLKSKAKKNLVKASKAKIKKVMTSAKTAGEAKKLLKSAPKQVRKRRPQQQQTKAAKPEKIEKAEADNLQPPVLEPIFPIGENVDNKNVKKKGARPPKIDNYSLSSKKIKLETIDGMDNGDEKPKKPQRRKQPKAASVKTEPEQTESMDEVMDELMLVINQVAKGEDVEDKAKVLKTRKENIENTLTKLSNADREVIDRLDLNVRKFSKSLSPTLRRRHSIEKFPVEIGQGDLPSMAQLSLLGNVPIRGMSLKSKPPPKARQSVDSRLSRRGANPYKTRSDSPAHILRNGKHRKLKDQGLLGGVPLEYRRRRRNCSDLSGSELSRHSKFSGNESDSSFSDMSSLHGGAEGADGAAIIVKAEAAAAEDAAGPIIAAVPVVPSIEAIAAVIKRSISTEEAAAAAATVTDTNSNLCAATAVVNFNEATTPIKSEMDDLYAAGISPSAKVPDKSIILDNMKRNFNFEDDKEKRSKVKSSAVVTPPKGLEPAEPAVTEAVAAEPETVAAEPETVAAETVVEETVNAEKVSAETVAAETVAPETVTSETVTSETVTSETLAPETVAAEIVHAETVNAESDPVESDIVASVQSPAAQPSMLKVHSTPEKDEIDDIINAMDKFASEEAALAALISPQKISVQTQEDSEGPMEVEEQTAAPSQNGHIVGDLALECPHQNGAILNGDSVKNDDTTVTPDDLSPSFPENSTKSAKVEETPENLAIKENILKALGLQSMSEAARQAQMRAQRTVVREREMKERGEDYTGTLKTVIKLNKRRHQKKRNTMKSSMQKHKDKVADTLPSNDTDAAMKDGPSTSWKTGGQSSDTAGAHRKSHYPNRSNNMDGSSSHSEGEAGSKQEGVPKTLVIPEKASSFNVHPERLCTDVCCYCYGKFGIYDTPCHIAQLKSVERQSRILQIEKNLTTTSCLCDACYRHVDRRANIPSYTAKTFKRGALAGPAPREDHCHTIGCMQVATSVLRRKWIIKLKKNVAEAINIDLDNPGLHSIPLCEEHYLALEHVMVCGMCKRRLAKNHVHHLGPETSELTTALHANGVPISLTDKPIVCKLCKYFSTIILQPLEDRLESSANFFIDYKKRLLHFNDIVPMDEAAAEEPITVPGRDKLEKLERMERERESNAASKRKRKAVSKSPTQPPAGPHSPEHSEPHQADYETKGSSDQSRVPSSDSTNQSRPDSPSEYMREFNIVDYNTLIPSIAMECGSDSEPGPSRQQQPPLTINHVGKNAMARPDYSKHSVEITRTFRGAKGGGGVVIGDGSVVCDKASERAVQRLQKSNPAISVRQLFPCEEDLPLAGNIEFGNVKERTPEGWEKCTATVQYDMETKQLWQELQKPYGNQSSFLRHLILLEKYFRNGDLVLAPNASHHSISYSESVHNRLRAYDNIPSSAGNVQPLSMIPFNRKPHKSTSGIITSASGVPPREPSKGASLTPITISQLNSPPLIPPMSVSMAPTSETSFLPVQKTKAVGAPPGLISLQPGTSKPVGSLVNHSQIPQAHKIKFPITKHWRPTLIPIEPYKKNSDRTRTGLVQVIAGGTPYHITLDDYKKMCAIKKTFEVKQRRIFLQEAVKMAQTQAPSTSLLKRISDRKGLVISRASSSPPKDGAGGEMVTSQEVVAFLERLKSEGTKATLEKLDHSKVHTEPTPKPSVIPLVLPKIPKSLTVIPQAAARKVSRPSSPILMITQKPKQTQPNKS